MLDGQNSIAHLSRHLTGLVIAVAASRWHAVYKPVEQRLLFQQCSAVMALHENADAWLMACTGLARGWRCMLSLKMCRTASRWVTSCG